MNIEQKIVEIAIRELRNSLEENRKPDLNELQVSHLLAEIDYWFDREFDRECDCSMTCVDCYEPAIYCRQCALKYFVMEMMEIIN